MRLKRATTWSVLGILLLETVAFSSIVLLELSVLGLVVLYWFDLLALTCRTMVAQSFARLWNSELQYRVGGAFELLVHKRGSFRSVDWLPPIYPRNVRFVVHEAVLIVISAVLTVVLLATIEVPAVWSHPNFPVVFVSGLAAIGVKHIGALSRFVQSGNYTELSAPMIVPRKRLFVFLIYGFLARFVGFVYVVIADLQDPNAPLVVAIAGMLVVVGRALYGVYAARQPVTVPNDVGTGSAWRRTVPEPPIELPPPAIPKTEPRTRVRPNSRAIRLAGALDALLGGGVAQEGSPRMGSVQLRFAGVLVSLIGVPVVLSELGVQSRALLAVITVVVFSSSAAILALLGVVHFELALGSIEYRLYDDVVVAYDRHLQAAQWRIPYRSIQDVSVERGFLRSPLWMDTGSVSFTRMDDAAEDDLQYQSPHSRLPFVDDPERVASWLHRGPKTSVDSVE